MTAAGAFLFLALWYGQQSHQAEQPGLLVLEGGTMGTTWSVQLVPAAGVLPAEGLAASLQERLAYLDRSVFSTYVADSELMLFNAAAPQSWVEVSPELYAVLALATQIHQLSGGSFDPAVGPLVRLWGFGAETAASVPPSAAAIETARASPGITALQFDAGTSRVMKTAAMELDLSGIAKGYAVDAVASMLLAAGQHNFIVEIGGELRVSGAGRQGQGWTLAIEQPDPLVQIPYAAIRSAGAEFALAGSGSYRNFRVVGNRRYSHEIDPRTGYPVDHALAAVTVLAANAAEADAWATALMVLGPDEGLAMADETGTAAYFIISTAAGLESRSSAHMRARFPDL